MNPTEFKQTVLPLKDKMFRLALRMLNKREEAEDLVQEALIKLWQQHERLGEVQNLEAWVIRLTKNQCIDKLRGTKNGHKEWKDGLDQADSSPLPDAKTESADTMHKLQKLMERLPENQRLVMHLRDIEGMSYQEVADSLDLPLAQVKINLFRARQAMKNILDLLGRETAWLKNGLFSLLIVYFFVHSAAMHSKISLNQEKNPLFFTSSALVPTSLSFVTPQA